MCDINERLSYMIDGTDMVILDQQHHKFVRFINNMNGTVVIECGDQSTNSVKPDEAIMLLENVIAWLKHVG